MKAVRLSGLSAAPLCPSRDIPGTHSVKADMSQRKSVNASLTEKHKTNICLLICKVCTNMAKMRIFEIVSGRINIVVENV
jgi:hypothetical protein